VKLFSLIFLLVFSKSIFAAQTIQVHWPFSVASTQANMIRALLSEANAQQTDYKFVFAHKPGAGGSIAANSSLSGGSSILISTSSFYIRPLLYSDSHDVNKFNLVEVVCNDQPLAVFSTKYSTIDELRSRSVTVGVIPGSITNLVTRRFVLNNLQISEVFYKGTPEATADVLGAHIDLSIDFLGERRITENSRIKIIGITGSKSFGNYRTLASQNITGTESITNSYFIFLDKNADSALLQKLREIFSRSKTTTKVQEFCQKDYGSQKSYSDSELTILNETNKTFWKIATSGVIVK
jgi:tripartite-type tricarboxylate transporter receptor subunit TctC